jgi:methyl-accepting chemotaxis protein
MAESASQANDATSLIAAGVEEMSVSITDISQRTQETSRITNESGKLASDGGATIERTVLAINDIADAIRQASRDVTALGRDLPHRWGGERHQRCGGADQPAGAQRRHRGGAGR